MGLPTERLTELMQAIDAYARGPTPDLYERITTSLLQAARNTDRVSDEHGALLLSIMNAAAKIEAVWGLLAGLGMWEAGRRSPVDFQNIWSCSRFAGLTTRFSPLPAAEHLARVAAWPLQPAVFIIRGNALRQLHRYAEAESCYLEGIERFPGNPFLRFRLADFCLMTYRLGQARQILSSLRAAFPQALEMMFALPVPADIAGPAVAFPDLPSRDAEFIWLIAADPRYAERFGEKLAKSIAETSGARAQLHVHIVRDPGTPSPAGTLASIARLVPCCSTERTVPLEGASPNQRSAVFAAERFLVVADLLLKYKKPLIVTDIDVECLRDPSELFSRLGDADIGLTKFREVRDAWDRYPATAIAVRPTDEAVRFFRSLAGMIIHLIANHPQPWFSDQIALYRLIEEGLTDAKTAYLEGILTDHGHPAAFFRILHGSWD